MNDYDFGIFKKNYLVGNLSEAMSRELAQLASVEDYGIGKTLMMAGERDVDLDVILRGTVNVWCGNKTLAVRGPQSVIGEVALLDNQPRSATVTASTPISVARFRGAQLRTFIATHRDVGFLVLNNLGQVLTDHLRQTTEKLLELNQSLEDPWLHAT